MLYSLIYLWLLGGTTCRTKCFYGCTYTWSTMNVQEYSDNDNDKGHDDRVSCKLVNVVISKVNGDETITKKTQLRVC